MKVVYSNGFKVNDFWVSQLLRIQKKSYGTINDNADKIIVTTSIYMYNQKNVIKIDQILIFSSSIRIIDVSIFLWRYFKGSHQYMALRCSFKKLIKTLYNILPLCHLLSFLHQGFLQKNSPNGKGGKDQNGRFMDWRSSNNLSMTDQKQTTSHTTKKVKPFEENKTWGSTCTMIVWKENQNKDLLEILILETRKIAVVNLFKYSCTQKRSLVLKLC